MFDADRRLDSATARSIASLVGRGGGLFDLSVKESEGPSCVWKEGVNERVCRSRSVPSLICVRAADGRTSSLICRPDAIPAQSPDIGRAAGYSGDTDNGVKAPCLLAMFLVRGRGIKYLGCLVSAHSLQVL
jgi:hypothetical protein